MDDKNLTDYFKRYQYDPSIVGKSRTWFTQQVNLLKKENINRRNLFQQSGQVKGKVQVGNLYMYYYDPKYKEELPFYDRFPLVFPFEQAEGGFYGLNMHYLTPHLRFRVFEQLLKFKSAKTITDTTRLRYSYSTLKALSAFPLAKHCVKRYLLEHVTSVIRLVPATDWASALMLPTEMFAKASAQQVWKETAQGIRI
jgi:hypothetical protein